MNGRWVVPVVTILTVGITIVVFSLFSVIGWRCWRPKVAAEAAVASETAPPVVVSKDENPAMARDRRHMIERHLRARGIDDEGVLKVMGQLRRQDFVADAYREVAYADRPLPIGHEQTISQPFIVALMTQLARVKPESRVLDIGTGSGILAIAALKLGAAVAEGVDIDPVAVRTAGENAALNGVADKLTVLVGDLSDKASGKYDIITANIVANAIMSLAPAVPGLMADDAVFIASGIIDSRKDEVVAALEAAGLAVLEVKEKRGWECIVCKKA